MSKRGLSEIEHIAVVIALEAPKRNSAGRHTTYVRWALVEKLRAAIKAAGYDYDAARQHKDALEARRRRPADIAGLKTRIAQTQKELDHYIGLGYEDGDRPPYGKATIAEMRQQIAQAQRKLSQLEKIP